MDDATIQHGDPVNRRWMRYKFLGLIAGAIVAALALTWLSMQLYSWSGAAQLDLSLPSYDKLRSQVHDDGSVTFSNSGAIDSDTISNFKQQFDEQLEQTEGGTGFSSSALSDESLGIAMPKH